MNTSDEECQVTGNYAAYSRCGHSKDRWIKEGDSFPKCHVCGQVVAWTLLRETDRWGDIEFQDETSNSRYNGMTINERLFAANLVDDFDDAVQNRNRGAIICLLQQVGVSLPFAERITDAKLGNPSKYQ